jgi:FixJ family two-component response regulator
VKNLDPPARIESRREVFAIPVLSVSPVLAPNSHGHPGNVYSARPVSSLRIVSVSGYDPSAVALRAEKLHISDFLEKPFSRATICNAMKKAIGSLNAALA